jgi:uncharacterized protein (DUF58 family)
LDQRTALAVYSGLLDDVRGVRWPARRRVRGAPTGSHGSTRRGMGAEFTEYRAYRQGDDPRQLDWKLLARTDRAYVRLAEEQAILPTIVVVDASASLAYPAPRFAKWTQACQVAVGLAAVAHGSGDPVGLLVAAPDGVLTVPPRTRQGIIPEIASVLAGVTPAGGQSIAAAAVAARALLARGGRRGGRLVVVSDFLGDGGVERMVGGGGECVAVHIVAREELDPPSEQVVVTDPEAPALTRSVAGSARTSYLKRFGAWRDELAHAVRAAGAAYALVATDERPARAVRRIVAI